MNPLVAAASLAMGLLLGLLGGGGSILSVPILKFLANQPTKDAIATSLLVVAITSAIAVLRHAWSGRVRWKIGLSFGLVAMAGSYSAGWVAGYLPADALMAAFVFMMAVTGVMMTRPRKNPDPNEVPSEPSHTRAAAVGFGTGAVTGLVGAGGGFLIVPALLFFGGLPISEAVGTSLFVITMNAASGFAGHMSHAQIDPMLVGWVSGFAVLGALGGTAMAGRIRPGQLRKAFGIFVLVMAGLTAFMTWSPLASPEPETDLEKPAHAGVP